MSSEKSVPGEGAREAELQVEMKKMQVSQITHFPENSREVPSSERELDATPIIPNPQDQDSPEGPADTSPVTSTAPGPNIPEIAEDTTPFTCTAQDHNTPEIAEDTAPATTAQDHNTPEIAEDTAPATCTAEGHSIPEFAENESSVTSSAPADNIPEITGDTTPVMGPSDTSSVISTAQGQGIPEFDEDEPPDTSSVIPTPPESTVPKDPANSPSTTPASVSPPGEIKIDSVEIDSVSLSWGSPDNMDGIPHSFHITYSSSDKSDQDSITTPSNSTVISELRPGREYSFTVTTVLKNGTQSTPVSTAVCTKPSPPGEIKIDSLEIDSVSLSWGSPDNMDGMPHSFYITYSSYDKSHQDSITAPSNSTVISKLRPGREYSFTVTTVLENGTQSTPVSTSVCTKLSPPGEIKIDSVEIDLVSLSWGSPDNMDGMPHSFYITYSSSDKSHQDSITAPSNSTVISKLRPGREYSFTVTTVLENGTQSTPVSTSVCTKLSPPGEIKIDSVESDSVSLIWDSPVGIDGILHSFKITFSSSDESDQDTTTAVSNSTVISKLRPGREYSFTVTTELENGTQSTPVSTSVCTKTHLEDLLCRLGLENCFPGKITLSTVLEIGTESITDEPIQSLKKLPWCFLKSLMMVNVTARSTKCSAAETDTDSALQDLDSVLKLIASNDDQDTNIINPLDLLAAVFLCSDSFLQQEMMSKMSMCQFAVPLLLPDCSTSQCTLMLWAMRDIVKKFRPRSLIDSKGFVEGSIVSTAMPMISFVRLGDCSLSKSQILNQVLSNPQQYHDFFIHRDMECGDVPRRIANGLVEIGWYLPCGKKNLDIFPEPVAVANLRGDLLSFQKQFSILCQTSSAVFIFFDSIADSECKLLSSAGDIKAQLYLVANFPNKTEKNIHSLKDLGSKLQLSGSQILFKKQQTNDAEFVSKLRSTMNDIMENCQHKMTIEGMSAEAHELGIPVDEDYTKCQNAKRSAAEITSRINDVVRYKEDQLPLQGKLWKELAKIEKEECRLRKAGSKPIEEYKSNLRREKQKLRKQQIRYNISEAMQCFIAALSNESKEERSYFLKWMRMNLDVTARKKLSGLRDKYKDKCCKFSENKEIIADLDRQISDSSLGMEHFMREMGQLYEAACSLPDNAESRQQFQHLPSLGAELLLDGFPLELVDGDASNIPVRWVTDVLTELHRKVQHKSRLLVVTVLGVQSTGKSTLLNTMFGVQFAVSSGRCTRGAFMLLIRVKEDLKQELNCDFILVIDTEGLKSPELAQLEDSYEHDNELATLVVGLSDVTIINIAMENSTEMKDILQIVVHAFLRMKEVGKKPNCQFVHQNVGDVSAHDNNARDRNKLLEQLNEMTQAAARMEKKGHNTKFTDIMEYDAKKNNWYIPGLWHGNPPMAPVNTGYSETVYQFKKSLIEVLKNANKQKPPAPVTEFLEWVGSLWKAVKYEHFIFSFRNSLVAEAYSNLCVEYNKWEWDFRKHMYNWLANAETRISNLDTSNYEDFSSGLKAEASAELAKEEKQILQNLTDYYQKNNGHVNLVEKHREDFVSCIKSLRREIERSVNNKCENAIALHKGMKKMYDNREEYTAVIEGKVQSLLETCRERNSPLSDEELQKDFEEMWNQTVSELKFQALETRAVASDILNQLRTNLERHGSQVQKELSEVEDLTDCGKEHFIAQAQHFESSDYQKMKEQPAKTKTFSANRFMNLFKRQPERPLAKELENRATEKAHEIIQKCRQFVLSKAQSKSDYHDICTMELLQMIDKELKNEETVKTNAQFELDLKLHICGYAVRAFQKMHEDFNEKNDPKKALEKFRPQYCSNFIDLYHEKDQCRKTAEEFTERCLKPAVREYINKALGIDIVDEMLTGAHSVKYSSRSFFQFSILKQILEEDNFGIYVEYIKNYETFVKGWISDQIVQYFTTDAKIGDLETKLLETITKKIQAAIENAQKETAESQSTTRFIQMICRNLNKDLVVSREELGAVLFLKNSNHKEFAKYLQVLVNELTGTLRAEFSQQCDAEKKLVNLPFKPQDELFKRVFGCGKQCPFCKVPCEAGGKDHKQHHASVHRPQGLGMYRWSDSKKLHVNICSTDVHSDQKFQSPETEWKSHPYKDYRRFYPDWNIAPDASIEASDYWKYVLTAFNKQFAEEYKAQPADIPAEWKTITKRNAMKCLNKLFNVKKSAAKPAGKYNANITGFK